MSTDLKAANKMLKGAKLIESKTQIALQKANERFQKMPPAKKRVAIAKDALAQLKRGAIHAKRGTYCSLDYDLLGIGRKQLNEAIKDNHVTCNVCAKGALFISEVMFNNSLKVRSVHGTSEQVEKRLRKYFSIRQLNLIECAFEASMMNFEGFDTDNDEDIDLIDKAREFGDSYETSEEILEAILLNIIKNKGEFVP